MEIPTGLPQWVTVESSGTEGKPRSIEISAETLYASARMGAELEQLGPGDCWLNALSLNHVGGIAIAYRCAAAKAYMVRHDRFQPERIEWALRHQPITHLSLVPVMLWQLLQQFAGRPPPTRLRSVVIGGDRLPYPLAQQAVEGGWPLLVGYGMTETASRITLLRLDRERLPTWEESDVGPPLPGVAVEIGERGEIRIRSGPLFPGEQREIVTADHGSLDTRGHLRVLGRLDHRILSAGRLIDPLAVEQALRQRTGLQAVGVTAVPDPVWGERIVAVVEAIPGNRIRQAVREQLPSAIRPRDFIVVEQLRYNAGGKLDRAWLKQVVTDVA